MKVHVKKKRYQAHCREQVKQGLMNDQTGNWLPISRLNSIHRRMYEDQVAGYRLNR